MISVLSIPLATSTSCRGASSMKEYSLMAFTSSEIRHELCSMSVSRREISSVAPKRRIAGFITCGENFCASRSRCSTFTPASASTGATSQPSSTPCSSSQVCNSGC